MNPVLLLTRNCLELTKRCVESVQKQDIPTVIYVVDNGSTDGTKEWLLENRLIQSAWFPENMGVSFGWNDGLGRVFATDRLYTLYDFDSRYQHCLVINNDLVLPTWFYSELLSYSVPFVTGIGIDALDQLPPYPPERGPLFPHPGFSAYLIRREAWEKVGKFDERMKLYCSDCDYHIRAHRLGIPLMNANVPFYHERSSTLRLASDQDRQEINTQANKDREVFQSIYGCLPGQKAYEAIFL